MAKAKVDLSAFVGKLLEERGVDTERRGVCHALQLAALSRPARISGNRHRGRSYGAARGRESAGDGGESGRAYGRVARRRRCWWSLSVRPLW
jgi:hypothetical protein